MATSITNLNLISSLLSNSTSTVMLCLAQKSSISRVSLIPRESLPPTIFLPVNNKSGLTSVTRNESLLVFFLNRRTRKKIGSSRGFSGKPKVKSFPLSLSKSQRFEIVGANVWPHPSKCVSKGVGKGHINAYAF